MAERTRVKNRLRGLLRRNGIERPEHLRSLWRRAGLRWLSALDLAPEELALERDLLHGAHTHTHYCILKTQGVQP